MASREEEKRKRREERMAAEAAAAAAQNRRRKLQLLLGALAAAAVIAVVVLAVSSGGGSDKGNGPSTPTAAKGGAKLPALQQADLAKAARAAGCKLLNPALEGAGHVTSPVKYKSNPPSSGSHDQQPALDGIYDPAKAPATANYLHALEHSRVAVQYRAGTPKALVAQLETLVSEQLNGKAGYKTLLFQNTTRMPYAVAAVSWGHILGCASVRKPQIWDALRDFRAKYVDQGPEKGVPPTN